MIKWIFAEDKLPSADDQYLIITTDGEEFYGWYISRKEIFVSQDGSIGYDVILWRETV